MRKIRVLIIDDERNARSELKRMIAGLVELELVGEASNADEAEILIKIQQPDLLFLDIQMPERSGFELLETLGDVPFIIFTTAFDEYAVKAFEVNAIDYLLKPIRYERLSQAIQKVSDQFRNDHHVARVFIKEKDSYYFLQWDKVHLIESMDNYAKLFFEDKNIWYKSSLNNLESILNKSQFFRCNRAQIINLNFVEKITTSQNSKLTVHLRSGQVIEVSERRSVQLRALRKI